MIKPLSIFKPAWIFMLAVLLSCTPLLMSQPTTLKGEEETTSKAVTVDSDEFLKVPAGLDTKTFTISKTAPKVDVCFFAGLKDKGKGTLYSSWGDGCLHSNGKYYTTLGDHLGKDANSYVYEYDPLTKILRRVVDVLQAIAHMLGLYGHGKIHSGIHEAADGTLYFATYWGKPKEIEAAFTKGFKGSVLLRFDPKTGKTENLGAIVPKQGLPASYLDSKRQLLYFHAVYKGDITVFDLKSRQVKFHGGGDSSAASRTFMCDTSSGRMYFSANDGTLHFYNPDSNKLEESKAKLPASAKAKKGDTLRAAVVRPTKSGILFGMTAPGQMFAFDPKTDAVNDLGPNIAGGDYTAVMVISPDDKYLYYAPGAHGSGTKTGVPVMQYEIATGQRKVLAFLQQPLQQKLKYNIGGTYNLQMDPSGERLFVTFNGNDQSGRGVFGKCAVVVVHIPPSER